MPVRIRAQSDEEAARVATTNTNPRRNPAFDPSPELVDAKWHELTATLFVNPRPLVVLCGWRAPLAALKTIRTNLRVLLPGTRVIPIAFPTASSMQAAVATTREALATHESTRDNAKPIDIVALSMGGLVARALACDAFNDLANPQASITAPVKINSLYTIATPHQGAILAKFVRPDAAASAMRPGSLFLRTLDNALPNATFSITPYGYLRDWWVGCHNTAPIGRVPLWLDPPTTRGRLFSHFLISTERRIILDIALRLRGLAPIAEFGPPPPK